MAFGLMHGTPTSLYAARSIRTFSVSRHPASGPIPCPSDDEIRLSALWFFVPGDLLGVGPAGYYARRGALDESLAQAGAGMSGANLLAQIAGPDRADRRVGRVFWPRADFWQRVDASKYCQKEWPTERGKQAVAEMVRHRGLN